MPKVSYSSLSTYRECRRKYAYRYVDGLAKDSPPGAPLLIGSWFHGVLALDAIRRGLDGETLLNLDPSISLIDGTDAVLAPKTRTLTVRGKTLDLTGYSVIRLAEEWWARLESDHKDEIVDRAGAPLPERLADLYERYLDRWAEALEQEEPLLVEAVWRAQIPDTDVIVSGRVDQVFRDRRRGIVVVRDHKLVKSWPMEPDAVLDLMDSQLHLYAWGIGAHLADLATFHNAEMDPSLAPAAIEYDRIRYKMPTKPKLTQKGVLSKAVTDFDLPTYIEFVEEEGIDVDPTIVASLEADPDRFFRRRLTPVNHNVIREHLRSAVADAIDADRVTSSADAPRTPTRSCTYCDFLGLCRGQLVGSVPADYNPEDFGLRRRT